MMMTNMVGMVVIMVVETHSGFSAYLLLETILVAGEPDCNHANFQYETWQHFGCSLGVTYAASVPY